MTVRHREPLWDFLGEGQHQGRIMWKGFNPSWRRSKQATGEQRSSRPQLVWNCWVDTRLSFLGQAGSRQSPGHWQGRGQGLQSEWATCGGIERGSNSPGYLGPWGTVPRSCRGLQREFGCWYRQEAFRVGRPCRALHSE